MNMTGTEDKLVSYLLGLKDRGDRGALAALRSGIGKNPGEAPRMYPHVGPFLSSADPVRTSVRVAFATASLFAMHPQQTEGRSLGLALWHSVRRDGKSGGTHVEEGVEKRFSAALDAHPDDLINHVQGLISLCESSGQGLDWYRFRRDLYSLLSDDEESRDRTRLHWARDFWQGPRQDTKPTLPTGSEQ
jgi:CRISPR type I-E-associated protein CasB/Cse2